MAGLGRRRSAIGQVSSGKWQAAMAGSPLGASCGSSTSHVPGWKRGQRGWKRQAAGGLIGLGTSPSSTIGLRARATFGFGIGTADSSAPV